MEIKFTNYEYNGKSINIEISDKNIIGITGNTKSGIAACIGKGLHKIGISIET